MLRTSGLLYEPTETARFRFWMKVSGKRDPWSCWLWTGPVSSPLPYGKAYVYLNGTKHYLGAHRVAWALTHGYWPFDHVDHLCDNHQCVNPNHLADVTRQQNMTRLIARGRNKNQNKEHCPRGHAYDKTRRRSNGRGSGQFRCCSICNWDVEKERRARKKAEVTGGGW